MVDSFSFQFFPHFQGGGADVNGFVGSAGSPLATRADIFVNIASTILLRQVTQHVLCANAHCFLLRFAFASSLEQTDLRQSFQFC